MKKVSKHLWWNFLLIRFQDFRSVTLLKKTSTQIFSCEYFETFKNNYFVGDLLVVIPLSQLVVLSFKRENIGKMMVW